MSEQDITDDQTPQGRDGSDAPQPKRRWRPRALHIHMGLWSSLGIALLVVVLIGLSMALTGRAIVLPAWVAQTVETRINDALPEGEVRLRRVELGVARNGNPQIRLVDVGLRDATGLDIAQLNAIQGGVQLGPLMRGEVVPRNAVLLGAQITFRRLSDGTFALQFGQGDTARGSLSDMIDAVDAVFHDGVLSEARRVGAEGLTITLEDARSGRIWQVTDGNLLITQTDNILETEITFDVFNQTDELAEVELSLRSDKTTPEATLSASFTNAAASDIGAQAPALSFLQLVDAPVSGALRTALGQKGEITDLAGALQIDEGGIRPVPGARPVGFGGAKGYIDYDPEQNALSLSGLSFISDLGEAEVDGRLYLADFVNGWPQAVLGQMRLTRARLNDPELFDMPLDIEGGYADMRLKLSPFSFEVGQAVLFHEGHRYEAKATIGATREAWDLAIDIEAPALDVAELRKVWPIPVAKGARKWVFDRVEGGELSNVHMALRGPTVEEAEMLMSGEIADGTVKVLPTLPPVQKASGYLSLAHKELVVHVHEAEMHAPQGDVVQAGGTSFTIPNVNDKPGDGIADVVLEGPLKAGFGLLDLPPLNVFEGTGFGIDVASGRFAARGTARFPLLKDLPVEDVVYNVAGLAYDVRSTELVPGSTLTAERLAFRAQPDMLEVEGPLKIGLVPVEALWRQPMGGGVQGSTVTGTVTLSEALNEEFNFGLGPEFLSGEGVADFTLDLIPGEAPRLTANSDLAGVTMAIPGTGWSKAAASTGRLDLEATLGARPEITSVSIALPGLTAQGSVTTAQGGGLDAARFARVELGGWLDAPVTITGRGSAPVAISVEGGSADFRKAELDTGAPSGAGGGGAGPSEPLNVRLDNLIIAKGIVLRDFVGEFDLAGGLSGKFTSTAKGGGKVNGVVTQRKKGTAYKITSPDGGRVLNSFGVFTKARGGQMVVTLKPTGQTGTFEGELLLENTRLVDAPVMAELLAAISIVGLFDQMDGEGISFPEVKGQFRLDPDKVTLYSSSAISASLGLSMDGYYDLNTNELDMQGTLSPFYLVNAIGRIVSARDGEGLVGFNFTLTGPDDDLEVGVNPLSVLTPGFLREIFRRQAPQQPGK